MHGLRQPSHFLPAILVALLLAGHCARAAAEASAQVTCGGRVRLTVPEGWQLTQAGDSGAVLRSPEAAGSPVELVGWDVPRGGEASPGAAAAAQETLLFRTSPYARLFARDFPTSTGEVGLLVVGQVKAAGGAVQNAVFVAFAVHQRYYVIGTFRAAGTEEDALGGAFGEVLRSLRFVEPTALTRPAVPTAPVPTAPAVSAPSPTTPDPLSQPAPVALPVAPPLVPPATPPPVAPRAEEPRLSAPQPPGEGLPARRPGAVLPANPEPAPQPALTPPPLVAPPLAPAPPQAPVAPERPARATAPPVLYESPLGFRLQHPAGWQVAVVKGHIEVTPPAGDGSGQPGAMALIWPLGRVAAGQNRAALARLLLGGLEGLGGGLAGLLARDEGDCTVLAGSAGVDGAQRRIVACCYARGDSALLTAMLSRPEEFEANTPALAGILASFSAGPWWADYDGGTQAPGTLWKDPTYGVLQVPVPPGWKTRGGLQNYNGLWTLFVETVSNDSRRITLTWQQPLVPLYRELTPVLRNLGWQEGDKYLANPGDQQLRILSRLSPQDFLTRYWLATPSQRLEGAVLDRLEARGEPAELLGEKASGLVAQLHGVSEFGPRQREVLIATADAPARIGANCWQAAVLQADAPAGAMEDALETLRALVAGAELVDEAPGKVPLSALATLLRGAQGALRALPPPLTAPPPARDVLGALNTRGKGDLWLLSPTALSPWQHADLRLRSDEKPGDVFPELGGDYWK